MLQLKRVPMTDNFLSLPIPTGSYKKLIVHFFGTNQAGQTLANTQLGTVRMMVNNKQFNFVNDDRLIFYNGLKKGSPANVSAIGAGFNFQFEIPLAKPEDDKNVLFVESDGEVVLELNGFYQAGVAVILTGTCVVYGEMQDGVQSYYYKIDQPDYTAVAGIGNEDLKGIENAYEILLENDTVNLNEVVLHADGKRIISADRQALVNKTNNDNQIETYDATIAFLDFMLAPSKKISESLSDSVSIQTNMTASSLLNVVVFSVDFAPQKQVASAFALQQRLEANLNRKGSQRKTRPQQVLTQ